MIAARISLPFLFFLASCGGGGASSAVPDNAAPPPPLTADALLPSDSFLVAKLDLIRLRESSNWDLIEAWLLVAEENVSRRLPSLGDGELRRWVSLTDRVWIGLAPSSDPHEPDIFGVFEGRFEGEALSMVARLPGLVAAYARLRRGEQPIAPPSDFGYSASFLYQLHGGVPGDAAIRALDTYLVTVIDHGANAITQEVAHVPADDDHRDIGRRCWALVAHMRSRSEVGHQ